MIIVQLLGGLGNQLFQYAMAKSLALEKKQQFSIDISSFKYYKLHHYALDHFNIEKKVYKKPNRYVKKMIGFFKKTTYYKEKDFYFNASIFDINESNIYLEGYFQSEKYFVKYEKEIRKDFEIISPLKKQTQEILQYIEKVNAVSLHIRRGDYLQHKIHNTNKTDYYKTAMVVMESKVDNPVYFIFSDDMPWAKENFKTNCETIFVDCNDALTNFEDLKLMSACKHNIIANSSFSWWGAWLNTNKQKIVIAPQLWYNDNTINTNDVIPESWIKI